MQTRSFLLNPFTASVGLALALAGTTETVAGSGIPNAAALERFASEAVAPEAATAESARVALRLAGPAGLDALWAAHGETIRALEQCGANCGDEREQRLRGALDFVGGQRDAFASRLYWFTDFAAAKRAAIAADKPILSLRLLGRLDEEFSCANSRFFRTALYANAEVAEYLRAHFILHWESVRPVPKVTIDFGDGRTIQTTLTGNSIHYVLEAHGQVIDALPGLYAPGTFLAGLQHAEVAARKCAGLTESDRAIYLEAWHAARARLLDSQWRKDLERIGVPLPGAPGLLMVANPAPLRSAESRPPSARVAATVAVSKSVRELPVLRVSTRPDAGVAASTAIDRSELERLTTDARWTELARLRGASSRLDSHSVALMRAKGAGTLHPSGAGEEALARTVRNFERSLAEDTVRNEYLLHTRLHTWLAAAPLPGLEALNNRVYAELFLTPASDPWLGLVPPDTYSALENDGALPRGIAPSASR
ncbi:MAG: hypothetical protein QOE70_2984 [Chthoniobacter sp.]|jgi:hypothetical protein|nr:hypothetical protein [Chthoniobacter sp.]